MQLMLDLNKRAWFIRVPAWKDGKSVWSDWQAFSRNEALCLIERGFSFETR